MRHARLPTLRANTSKGNRLERLTFAADTLLPVANWRARDRPRAIPDRSPCSRAMLDVTGLIKAFDVSSGVENLRIALSDRPMPLYKLRLEVTLGSGLMREIAEGIDAAYESSAVLTGQLSHVGRNIADRKADPSLCGRIGRRPMNDPHMMQRHLPRL